MELEREEAASLEKEGEALRVETVELRASTAKVKEGMAHKVDVVALNVKMNKKLEERIVEMRTEASKQRKRVIALERQRERNGVLESEANRRFAAAVAEVQLREKTIADLQKSIREGEAKLGAQQQEYEQLRAERNRFSKQLIENQDEIAEMKRKFRVMSHQMEQLKDEARQKDEARLKERTQCAKAEKEKEALKNEQVRT